METIHTTSQVIQHARELQEADFDSDEYYGGINWLSTEINPPKAAREIIAKNPNKVISENSSAKQCQIMKFHSAFSEDQIVNVMMGDHLTLWSYV